MHEKHENLNTKDAKERKEDPQKGRLVREVDLASGMQLFAHMTRRS